MKHYIPSFTFMALFLLTNSCKSIKVIIPNYYVGNVFISFNHQCTDSVKHLSNQVWVASDGVVNICDKNLDRFRVAHMKFRRNNGKVINEMYVHTDSISYDSVIVFGRAMYGFQKDNKDFTVMSFTIDSFKNMIRYSNAEEIIKEAKNKIRK